MARWSNGRLRHRVEVQAATATRDAFGATVRAFATIANGRRWASVEPLSGREFFEAQRVDSEITQKVTMRYDSRVTTSHRIRHDARLLEVVSIQNDRDINARMVLMCKEDT